MQVLDVSVPCVSLDLSFLLGVSGVFSEIIGPISPKFIDYSSLCNYFWALKVQPVKSLSLY